MNFKLPRVKTLLSIAGVLFLTAGVLAGSLLTRTKQNIAEQAAGSTNLYISPSTQSAKPNTDITFSVLMNTGSNNVTGVDVLLGFDPGAIQIDSVAQGSGISSFDNEITRTFDNSVGTVGYTAFTLDKNLSVKGSSIEVLKINAKVKSGATAGNSLLVFDPTSAVSAVGENQNALLDMASGTIIVLLSPTAEPTSEPTNPPGEPNSCGGTCGSNVNCNPGLFCYQGYCRNPSCSSESDCNCTNATTAPTPAPTRKPVTYNKTSAPIAKTTPKSDYVVVNYTPAPATSNFWGNTNSNVDATQPESSTPEPVELPKSKSDSMLPWIIGSFVAVGITLVLIAVGIAKHDGIHKSKPPVIKL